MSEPIFRIKQNDTSPTLIVTPIDENGDAVPLDAVVSVQFKMKQPSGALKVDKAAAVNSDEATDRLEYAWEAEDTDTDGHFEGEFIVTWSDGTITSFPNFRYIGIKIVEELA